LAKIVASEALSIPDPALAEAANTHSTTVSAPTARSR
jgi:hypothetical protein